MINSLKRKIKEFNVSCQVLATPMGKGVVDDNDIHMVGPARSLALQKADVVVLLGARLNWILHFGRPPRFDPNVKIIQVDIVPEELHNSVQSSVGLTGDVGAVVKQLLDEANASNLRYNDSLEWWCSLRQKCEANRNYNQVCFGEEVTSHLIILRYFVSQVDGL